MNGVYKTYRIQSEALAQCVTVTQLNTNGAIVQVISDDAVVYTSSEIHLLHRSGVKIDPAVHLVKRFFCGTIVKIGNDK